MRLSLQSKLTLAILLSIASVIIIMLVFMSWSFDRGFEQHVQEEEQRKDVVLSDILLEDYRINGDWSYIRGNDALWQELNDRLNYRPRRMYRMQNEPAKYRKWKPPIAERALLDKNKKVIVGSINNLNNYTLTPIQNDQDSTIAYLVRKPLKNLFNPRQAKFMRHLHQVFYQIAISALLIAILIAWVLSKNLLKPVRNISNGTNELATGNYTKRIEAISNDELGELAQRFNLLAASLEQNESDRKQWIVDISHELRTPLSVLRGEIEAMIDGVREVNANRLQSLHHEVMQLNQLIDDLHELSLSDLGALNYQMQQHNIQSILEQVISTLQLVANQKSIQLEFSRLTNSNCSLLCDRTRIQQLFTNIIMNSISYTNSPGMLKITLTANDENIYIAFDDSEPGVSDIELPRLFERLYRADSSRNRKTGGSGLGLSICHNIVQAHGGTINAERSQLGGLSIKVTLPHTGMH